MQIRDYSLPAGWYPRDSKAVSEFLTPFSAQNGSNYGSRAAISPHAGWYYSGALAAFGVSSLKRDAETIVILGGHLDAGSPSLFAMEDAVRTPFGSMTIDASLRQNLINELDGAHSVSCAEDRYRDNTIEVLLPMAHYFFPEAKLLWLRLPAEIESFDAGKTISRTAEKLNRKVNVLASTDLTHYGLNYGFSPKGGGITALRWVREVNDANFIKAVEAGDAAEALCFAEEERAACSAGAVLGAMGFAQEEKIGNARLLKYATSADVTDEEEPESMPRPKAESSPPASFVGYAAFAW
jgi:AmmeMemoRadiSam system protein B